MNYPRIIADPADALEQVIENMNNGIRARHPGAYAPPEDEDQRPDPEAMPDHELAVRKEMLALNEIPQLDHAARAEQLERIAQRAADAAEAEWALWRKWGHGDTSNGGGL